MNLNYTKLTLFGMLLFVLVSCGESHKHTNKLAGESSPYLLQHAHNPVNWYPWGEEALNKAKAENKLIIVSVGYAACHWCHVMEHESFENEEVAKLMNNNFVSIKVDREERPDIDQIYMEASQIMTGSGGWPLNCVTLPDGRPIFAGTYFEKDQWMDLLQQIIDAKKNDPERLESIAKQVTSGVGENSFNAHIADDSEFLPDSVHSTFANFTSDLDMQLGGFQRTQKFPMPNHLEALLQFHHLTQNDTAMDYVNLTLERMAMGGIYDQVGGGFARYSTDAFWKVPHFEKMLYDNAQLVSLYSQAYKVTKNPLYKKVVEETLAFVERELTSPDGGFYSSLDADSEGKEGKFYTWTNEELEALLDEAEYKAVSAYYNIEKEGNWEDSINILFNTKAIEAVAIEVEMKKAALENSIASAKSKLMEARSKRVRPGLDDKILTSWNALMVKGYIDAYSAFGKQKYLEKALTGAEFIVKTTLQEGNRLNRNYKDGKSSINAFLDDYALTVDAFITLYQVTFNEQWLYKAQDLTNYALEHFYDEGSGYFFYTSDQDPALIARKVELTDNVIPSANSVMAKNLYYLGNYFFDGELKKKSTNMLQGVLEFVPANTAYFTNWFQLQMYLTYPFYEVAIVGDNAAQLQAEFLQSYQPNAVLMGGKTEGSLELLKNKLMEGETMIYVCKEKACKLPVMEVEAAFGQMVVAE
ncbi:thioredoxin domain-containing protein [Flammeovirgaceae bacterium SG7u.111]|nr:thioredoxin domain-containing protein [Flammeovirgaceae bacterium SG7u.132]WPO36436.1 thioredoxin domain-containing protein [Flammeovirgaceae bacterium SG7u.111]